MYFLWILVVFIVPLGMMLCSGQYHHTAPKPYNIHTGYRTRAARQSKAHWYYAQSLAPQKFAHAGKNLFLWLLFGSLLLLELKVQVLIIVLLGIALGALGLYIAFCQVEAALNRYHSDGTLKREEPKDEDEF